MRTIYGINTSYNLTLADSGWDGGAIHDLGICQGRQYFSIEDATYASLPAQPEEAAFATATKEEITDLRKVSPVVQASKNNAAAAIRQKYTLEAELQALRLNDTEVLGDIADIVTAARSGLAELGFVESTG